MTVTALPTPPSRSDSPDTFVTKADAFIAALPTMVTEINSDIVTVNGLAASGGVALTWTSQCTADFTTVTTDADPTSARWRLNNTTLASATQLYIDELSSASGNPSIATMLDKLDDSTTSKKGVLKVYETATATNFAYWYLTAVTTATGYRKLTIEFLYASAAAPFGNNDACTFQFWPTGDAGNVASGVAMTNANLSGVKEGFYNGEITIATTTGAVTVNWTSGHRQFQTQPTGAITYSFTAPTLAKPCHLQLRIPSGSSAYTPSWPASFYWLGATWAPVANKTAFINIYYDGTNYWAVGVNQV